MSKEAVTRFPVHELISGRWSPLAFADRPVAPAAIGSLLEAARWAPSCFNAQPWRFFVATREQPERFARLKGLLVPGNAWAGEAPVLMLSVARQKFAHNDKPNRHAGHDVGLAVGSLVLQAQALGLSTHQMAGFDAAAARTVLGIPEDHEPMAMIAVGYRGEPEQLSGELRAREAAARERSDLDQLVFGETWGVVYEGLEG